ncbi:hypothetical protein TWF694_002303 [Orbilia ellipsospora]|uniref:SYO1-like TPR repeats domain-containing protein n=1 Tax=Orbilia ellipsospora TaxID=2528407 RepID=A0AAV9X443_9PEZI
MADITNKRRKKQSEPRAGIKSSATALFSWFLPQPAPNTTTATNTAEAEIIRDQKISPIIAGIQSAIPTERAQHLIAATSIIEDPVCRKLLLREHIVRLVMEQSLCDSAQEVVAAAWAFLNSLVLYEGYDVAVHLYRKEILKHVDGIIKNIEPIIIKITTDPKAVSTLSQSLLWDCAHSVVSLLVGLNETTQEVLEAVSNPKILEFVSKLLDPGVTVPDKVQTAAAVFLDRVTDKNEAAYAVFSQDLDFIAQLRNRCSSKVKLDPLQLTAFCSLFHNLVAQSAASDDGFSDSHHITDADLVEPLTDIITTTLSNQTPSQSDQQALFLSLETLTDIANQITETFGKQASPSANGINGDVNDMDEDGDEDQDEAMEEDDDVSEPEDEASDGEASDEEFPDELGADLAMVTGEDGTSARASRKKPLNSPILEYLVTKTIHTVLPIATSTPSSEPERQIKLTSIALLTSIARAFAILTSKSHKSKFTLPSALQDTYLPVTDAIWENLITPILLSNSADITLAEKITDLSIHITAFKPSVSISNGQHKSFLALYNATTSTPLKVLCVKVSSNLAQCQGNDRIDVNKEIGTFLIGTVNKLPFLGDEIVLEELPSPEVVIECLNGVYDVYADQDFDYDEEVFVKLGFLKYLRSFVGRVRGMAKRIDKRKQPELRESAEEALLNLNAFIKYKTEERQ